jgi:hypothetical protein
MEVQENVLQEQQPSSEQSHAVDEQQLEDVQGGGMCLSRPNVLASTNVPPVGNPSMPCLQRSVSQSPIGNDPSFRDWLPEPKPTLTRSLSLDSWLKNLPRK